MGACCGFFVSRVREPGTAERVLAGLGPERDRRMPGTRSSSPRRPTSPERDFSYSAGLVIVVAVPGF
jgi:hypothetical protein